MVRSGEGHTDVRAPSVAPPPAHPTAHPSTQHLESPPKPCHSLPPPSKAIPRLHTRVHGYVSVGMEWGGAHRRARTLCGTPSRPPHRPPLYPTLGITTKALPLPDPTLKGNPTLSQACTRVCERWYGVGRGTPTCAHPRRHPLPPPPPPTPLPNTWNHHQSLATPCPHPQRQSHAFTHVYTGM